MVHYAIPTQASALWAALKEAEVGTEEHVPNLAAKNTKFQALKKKIIIHCTLYNWSPVKGEILHRDL